MSYSTYVQMMVVLLDTTQSHKEWWSGAQLHPLVLCLSVTSDSCSEEPGPHHLHLSALFSSSDYVYSGLRIASYCTLERRRRRHPTPVLLPGKSHGQRSLVGCSPWGREGSDKSQTERLPFHFSLSCIGEGNGNPLQSSCLENPRDGGAWWAAIYGVTQSRTRLKQLSISSNLYICI